MRQRFGLACLILLVVALLVLPATALAASGWENDAPYNKIYDPQKLESVKGNLLAFVEVRPLPGMTPGLAMLLRTASGEEVQAQLGPLDLLSPLREIVHPGVYVKVKGIFAEVGGKEVFMTAKMRAGEFFELKLRGTRSGTPLWVSRESGHLFAEKLEQ